MTSLSTQKSWVWEYVLPLKFPFGLGAQKKTHICIVCADTLVKNKKSKFATALFRTSNPSNAASHLKFMHQKFKPVAKHFDLATKRKLENDSNTLSALWKSEIDPKRARTIQTRKPDGSLPSSIKSLSDRAFSRVIVNHGLPLNFGADPDLRIWVGDTSLGLLPGYVPPREEAIRSCIAADWAEFVGYVRAEIQDLKDLHQGIILEF